LASWRNRLGNPDARGAETPAATAVAGGVDAVEAKATEARPAEAAPARQPASEPSASGRISTIGRGSWRDTLLAWASLVLASPSEAARPPVVDDSSTLALAVRRLGLTGGAARGLALLYAGWLAGDGERGLAPATLASIVSAGEGVPDRDGPGWTEALGRGRLAELGLIRRHGGRVCLRRTVARFLDGLPPRMPLIEAPADDDSEELNDTAVVNVGGAAPLEFAEALCRHFARPMLLVDVDRGRPRLRVEQGLLDARLRQLLPLVVGTAEVESWSTLVTALPTLIAVREACPVALAGLPQLSVA
jgi:hypothetical protein